MSMLKESTESGVFIATPSNFNNGLLDDLKFILASCRVETRPNGVKLSRLEIKKTSRDRDNGGKGWPGLKGDLINYNTAGKCSDPRASPETK